MNALTVFIKVTELAVSFGTSTIITHAVKATTPIGLSNLSKVGVAVGTMAVGGVVSDAVSKYVTKGIENTITEVKVTAENTQNKEVNEN